MSKVKSVQALSKTIEKLKKENKTICLITGCFDIMHMGHISLFNFAKENVDYVVVGLDNDQTIKLSKGENRPMNKLEDRIEFMSQLSSVDYVFELEDVVTFGIDIDDVYVELTKKLGVTHIVTALQDTFWKRKKERAKKLGIKTLVLESKKNNSTSKIIEHLLKEL